MVIYPGIVLALNALVTGSIFFVWVVRYQNIIEEFKLYKLPEWLRDFVGILKLSFALMLHSSDTLVALLGASGIAVLMAAAFFTHLRVNNPFVKMIPAVGLLVVSLIIFYLNFLKL